MTELIPCPKLGNIFHVILCAPDPNGINWEKRKSPKSLPLIFPHEQHLLFRRGPELNPDLA